LQAVSQGQFILSGLRNSDLRTELYKPAKDPLLRRRHAAAVTRKLTILRAHGLLRKTPHSHRYQLTPKGRRIITALLAACHADFEQLTKLAA
jgi:DNA-binding HxlR family transcriptional regulator